MSDAGAEPSRVLLRPARLSENMQLALGLLIPALLIGLLRVWSLTTAPKQGLYFAAEASLIIYAYFAAIRASYLHAQSRDWEGRYDRRWALNARHAFYEGLYSHRSRIVIVIASLLSAGLLLDLVTAETGFQLRPNVHLSMMFVALMVWARYGAAVVIAAARWSPPVAPRFAEARELAGRASVARSFALLNLALGGAAVATVLVYKWAGALLPTARAELVCLVVVFTALAWMALWLHCRWAASMLERIGELAPSQQPATPLCAEMPADEDCPRAEAGATPYMVAPICQGTNSLSP